MPLLYYRRLVVLGARGFIGRILAERFANEAEIMALDLPDVDITNPVSLEAHLQSLQRFASSCPTAIVNAAGLMDAALSRREPDRFYRVNGLAVGYLKTWARKGGCSGFLHFSSETVFGAGEKPFDDDGPRAPLHPYGISKLLGEVILGDDALAPLPAVALRLPVVVGVGQAIGNPISMFCDEAMRTGVITLFNGGTHCRKFLDVDDVVSQAAAVLSRPMSPGVEYYNVGGYPASMREIADLVSERVGNIEIRDQKSKNQAFTLLSQSQRIEARYGFKPHVGLTDMIERFVKHKGTI